MAGLTSTGLEIKRLSEIISDRQTSARNYFGAEAAVGVNDVLGRALRIHSDSERDLWELAEAIHNAFNPDYATGNQLDMIVKYGGLTRFEAENASATLLVNGDLNAVLPAGSDASSSTTSEVFTTDESVTFNKTAVSGALVNISSAVEGQTYSITIGTDTASYTAPAGATRTSVAYQLSLRVSNIQGYTGSPAGSNLTIVFDDVFVPRGLAVSVGITITNVSKLVSSTAVDATDVEQPIDSIDTIATTVTGWNSVTNPEAAVTGRDRETDEELRVRFANSKEANAKGTLDAIFSNLSLISGVEDIQVYENTSNTTDSEGLPPHSFSVVILGGNSQTIADTIWETKPAGIATYGTTTVTVSDSQGVDHDINFSRPEEVDITITVTISEAENETLPSSAGEQVREALLTYFDANFGVGKDVIYSRLFIPIQSVQGVQVDSLTIGVEGGSEATSNVVIDFNQISNLIEENITVNLA